VHKQHLAFEDLRLSPDGTQLLCAQHAASGTANIASMTVEGSDYRELTGGDTVDTSPAWIPDDPDRVLFQSAGLARDPSGFAIAQGPVSIQMAHLKEGTLTPVREDPLSDFLQPRVGPDGSLYFIQRPYEPPRYGTGQALLDALLFPFRLLRAVFHYLNFFSLMYSRKPLTTASGPAMQADLKEILLKGKRVDAEEMLRKGALVSGVPSLVPASWTLVKRDRSGIEHVLARHVSSFDIAADGTVLFSNGCGVFVLDGTRSPKVVLRDQLIADVIVGRSP
ncbi:MAG: TolB family protein, partial [Panacagrimonas sp.]